MRSATKGDADDQKASPRGSRLGSGGSANQFVNRTDSPTSVDGRKIIISDFDPTRADIDLNTPPERVQANDAGDHLSAVQEVESPPGARGGKETPLRDTWANAKPQLAEEGKTTGHNRVGKKSQVRKQLAGTDKESSEKTPK